MIYPDIPLSRWLKKYPELAPPHTKNCDACRKTMKARPFLCRGYAGISGYCPCGKNKRTWSRAITTNESKYKEWCEAISLET